MRKLLLPLSLLIAAAVVAGCSANSGSNTKNDTGKPNQRSGPGLTKTNEDNTSTFALDVDTASYTYASALINNGGRPDPSQVRPEEFINYFKQRYPEPAGDGFSINTDGARLPKNHPETAATRVLRVGLQTRSDDSESRKDANLTFVVDVSGSMQDPGRLDLVKDALDYLIDQLRPSDSVAIVSFNDKAHVLREMTRVSNKDRLHSAVNALKADGSTNLGDGLVTGYQVARDGFKEGNTNRVIILSDGLANTGNTDSQTILAKIRSEADKQITLLGVGVGSDYGDQLMEQLADKGDGFTVYISERSQARDVFVNKLPATMTIRAYDAKAQVIFDKSNVDSYQLIGYEDRLIADKDFRDSRVDGGEVGAGHSVTALYLVRLRSGAKGHLADVKVRWLNPVTRVASERSKPVTSDDLNDEFSDSAPELRIAYAAGFFAQALRGKPAPDFNTLADIADTASSETDDKAAYDLAELIHKYARR